MCAVIMSVNSCWEGQRTIKNYHRRTRLPGNAGCRYGQAQESNYLKIYYDIMGLSLLIYGFPRSMNTSLFTYREKTLFISSIIIIIRYSAVVQQE